MSFGFSPGDMLAAITIAHHVFKQLECHRNAPKEFREIVDELEVLLITIETINERCMSGLSDNNADGLNTILNLCHAELRELADIPKRYGNKRGIVAVDDNGNLGSSSLLEAHTWEEIFTDRLSCSWKTDETEAGGTPSQQSESNHAKNGGTGDQVKRGFKTVGTLHSSYTTNDCSLSRHIANLRRYSLSLRQIKQKLELVSNGYVPQAFDPQKLEPHASKVAESLPATQLATAWASGMSMSLLFHPWCQIAVFLRYIVPSLGHILQTHCLSESAKPRNITNNLRLGLYLLSAGVYTVSLALLYMHLSQDRGAMSFFCFAVVIGLCFEGLIGLTAEQIWLVSMPLTVNFVLGLVFLWQRLRMHSIVARHTQFHGKEYRSEVGV